MAFLGKRVAFDATIVFALCLIARVSTAAAGSRALLQNPEFVFTVTPPEDMTPCAPLDSLVMDPRAKLLDELIDLAGLQDDYAAWYDTAGGTVLVPTNAAFEEVMEELGVGTMEQLLNVTGIDPWRLILRSYFLSHYSTLPRDISKPVPILLPAVGFGLPPFAIYINEDVDAAPLYVGVTYVDHNATDPEEGHELTGFYTRFTVSEGFAGGQVLALPCTKSPCAKALLQDYSLVCEQHVHYWTNEVMLPAAPEDLADWYNEAVDGRWTFMSREELDEELGSDLSDASTGFGNRRRALEVEVEVEVEPSIPQ